MLFTEMWLRPEIPSPTVEIKGFTYIHADRTESPACMSMTVAVGSVQLGRQDEMMTFGF